MNLASPDDSMMLLKPTAAVPHVGGGLMRPGEPYYEIMRTWISGGARLDLTTPRVTKIEVFPIDPVMQRIGSKQQLRVLATYSGGEVRDVTREAFLESANSEVAVAGRAGLITSVRRGEAPVLARFEGSYASTTLTVMGDRIRLCLDRPADLLQDRRTGRRQVEADEDPAVGALHRHGVCPPDLSRPDGPATDRRRTAQVPRRSARQPRQARRAGRSPDRQPRFRRLLDQQVGGPSAGQSQVPGCRRLGGLSQLDSRPGGRQHAL